MNVSRLLCIVSIIKYSPVIPQWKHLLQTVSGDCLARAALQHADCSTIMCCVDFEDNCRNKVLKLVRAKSNSCVYPRLQSD